jgi:hypothetical protein
MANTAYEFTPDKGAGFLPNPNDHKSIGYVTAFDGCGLASALPKDINVVVAYNGKADPTTNLPGYAKGASGGANVATCKVVGVIEKFSWEGGVGSPIKIEFWVSQQAAMNIKALQQSVLNTTKVKALGWWLAAYDQETKQWFEQGYPNGGTPITGHINRESDSPMLDVDLNGAPCLDGIEVFVYKISVSVVPAANLMYVLNFANSSNSPITKQWGLTVGDWAAAAMS